MDDLLLPYQRVRERMGTLFVEASPDALAATVPACPAWTVRDLAAHVVGIPAALAAGRMPNGDVDAWLQELVDERADQDVAALVAEWHGLDDAIAPMLQGPGALMFADISVHEHDLRGALGRPDHDALEVDVMLPRTLAAFSQPLQDAGLGAIVVEHDGARWSSHEAEPGWTLHVSPWEAVRAVNSRRTAAELLALPADGDAAPYLPILDAHLPLPEHSLGE
jgi:hypothetical protein